MISKKFRHPLVIIAALLLSSGCVNSSETTFPRSISLQFNVEDMGDMLTDSEGDSLIVRELKLHFSRFRVATTNSDTLESNITSGIVLTFSESNFDFDEIVLQTNIGFDLNSFDFLQIFQRKLNRAVGPNDGNFFNDSQTFSFFVRGSLNNVDFIYQSGPEFNKQFRFFPVTLTESNELLVLRLFTSVEEIFTGVDGSFLQPNIPDNREIIDANLEASLEVEASASSAVIE